MRFNERSSGLIDSFNGKIFHILGCGAIGSAAATQLACMGADEFILYDMDKVSIENIGVSQFNHKDIGRSKVNALKRHILATNDDANVLSLDQPFTKFMKPLNNDDIVILGFDNMTIRKEAAELACVGGQKPFAIIDGRMGAEEYQQYVIKDPTLKKYLKYWYADDDASSEPCNAKATSYCSNMSGSFIANSVKKLMMDEPYNEEFFFHFKTLFLGKSPTIG